MSRNTVNEDGDVIAAPAKRRPSHGIRPQAARRMAPRIVIPTQLRMRSRRRVRQ